MLESIQKSGWWNEIVNWDHEAFNTINQQWTSAYLDKMMPEITDLHKSKGFLVFAALMLLFWVVAEKARGLRCLLIVIVAIAATDIVSYRLIKPTFERDRPEFTEGMKPILRTHSHSGNSFPSNHAANMFAAATAISFMQPWLTPLLFGWAAMVAYSRVYVGVHYPTDVIAGALLGFLIAQFLWFLAGPWIEDVRFGYNGKEEVPRWKQLANSQPSGKRRKRHRRRKQMPPTTTE